jgi:hypothetical protein
MDFYQGVVVEYLRADRALFVNTEYCIQLGCGNPDTSGPHWYCDAVALDFREKKIWLCEISYARTLASLIKRLDAWNQHWDDVGAAVKELSALEGTVLSHWTVQPWLFVPKGAREVLIPAITRFEKLEPKITDLQDVQPWKFSMWDRTHPLLNPFPDGC